MKNDKPFILLYWVFAALPLLAAVLVYPHIPETIQITPEQTLSTGRDGIFIMPAAQFAFGVVFHVLSGKLNQAMRQSSQGPGGPPDTAHFFVRFKAYILGVLAAMCLCMIYGYYTVNTGAAADWMGRALAAILGVTVSVFALGLPRATKGRILALRWSYTEKSEQVWYRTHRLGARLLFPTGAAMVIAAPSLSGTRAFTLSCLLLALALITLYLYAKRLYEDEFFH